MAFERPHQLYNRLVRLIMKGNLLEFSRNKFTLSINSSAIGILGTPHLLTHESDVFFLTDPHIFSQKYCRVFCIKLLQIIRWTDFHLVIVCVELTPGRCCQHGGVALIFSSGVRFSEHSVLLTCTKEFFVCCFIDICSHILSSLNCRFSFSDLSLVSGMQYGIAYNQCNSTALSGSSGKKNVPHLFYKHCRGWICSTTSLFWFFPSAINICTVFTALDHNI